MKPAKPVSAPPRKRSRSAAAVARAPEGTADYVTTAIHLPQEMLTLLRQVAVARADIAGGRPSVSAVLVDLVRDAQDKLTREVGR